MALSFLILFISAGDTEAFFFNFVLTPGLLPKIPLLLPGSLKYLQSQLSLKRFFCHTPCFGKSHQLHWKPIGDTLARCSHRGSRWALVKCSSFCFLSNSQVGINLTHRSHYPAIDPSIATERIPSLILIWSKPFLSVPPPALAFLPFWCTPFSFIPPVWNVFAPDLPLTHSQRDFPDCLLPPLFLLPRAMWCSSVCWLLWPVDLSSHESIPADSKGQLTVMALSMWWLQDCSMY